ncbi:MAG: Asp23/Gls24 family envelope stress response protein [Tissierellia bacterium]|nr:Asp23/Gls24 family envelope stress response protein [Tissierellia bacterium]
MEKYFTDPSGDPSVKISEDVLTRIAQETAMRVDGVTSIFASRKESMREILNARSSKTKVTSGELTNSVDIAIVVEYGKNIVDVAQTVQEKILESIHNMTDLEIESVNVHVNGISTKEESALRVK